MEASFSGTIELALVLLGAGLLLRVMLRPSRLREGERGEMLRRGEAEYRSERGVRERVRPRIREGEREVITYIVMSELRLELRTKTTSEFQRRRWSYCILGTSDKSASRIAPIRRARVHVIFRLNCGTEGEAIKIEYFYPEVVKKKNE